MTDAEKIAAVRAVLRDVEALRQHFVKKKVVGDMSYAESGALTKIAGIVGE